MVLADLGDQRRRRPLVTGRTGERLLYTLRVKIFAHLQRLGLDYYERELSGRIMTRMTTDVDALSTFLQTGLITAMVSVLTFVGILVALLVHRRASWRWSCCAMLPLLLVGHAGVPRASRRRRTTEARETGQRVNADLQENVAGHARRAGVPPRGRATRQRFAGRSDELPRSRLRAQRYISVYFPFVQLLSTVAAALVLVVGAPRVRRRRR